MELQVKPCTRCKQVKPLNLEHFPPHNKVKSGFDSWCRACRATYRNEINRGKFRDVISDEALKELKSDVTQCVICGSEEPLVVDHDHQSGEVRGMLCNHCNRGLGHFRDDPMLLEFAAQYLYASSNDKQLNEVWEKYRDASKEEHF
jgi:hypothetical protein